MSAPVKRQIPLLDLTPQHGPIRAEIVAALERVLDSQRFILGEDVTLLERELAAYSHVKHAIACASGTDALILALLALGVRHGDRVLTTPFSFYASAGAITRVGATPVFADIDPVTFNLDPQRAEEAARQHPRLKAIIPVHLYGGCADMDAINEIAQRRGVSVVEDGAQSIGAEYKGRKAQSLSDVSCLSFFPTKNLGAVGDAGMVLTNHDGLAEKLFALHVNGSPRRYFHDYAGLNSRMDTLQAAVLRVKMAHLEDWQQQRQLNVALYRKYLAGVEQVTVPEAAPYQTMHVWHQFTIRAERRDELKRHLTAQGVGAEIYYPLPLHLQPCYQELGYRGGDFPEAERASREVLSLPVYPGLTGDDISYVADAVAAFYRL